MEENEKILLKEEEETKEDINNDLITKEDINEQKEIIQDNDNNEIKNENKNETNNENIIQTNNEDNKGENDKNKVITDYLITIQYSKCLKIPYFKFGNVLNFYCPFTKFESNSINLSQMPRPPFIINFKDCK